MDDRIQDVSPYLLRPTRRIEEVLAERARRQRLLATATLDRRPRLVLVHAADDAADPA